MALIFYLFMRANDCNVLLLLLLINEMYLNFEEKHFMLLFLCFSFLFYFIYFFMQDIIRPMENPIKKTGHIQILYGNLAPNGSVAKITGKEGLYFSGIILRSTFGLLFLKLYVI